ncbi:non-specific serine/threonine protein kinase OS=Streptomyces tendae OX=1932 GN=GUR47_07550 PE=4 SV=1 [Streptomyces tendae]
MRPVGSKYLLEEPLGRGATGTVWRARQRETAGAEAAVAGQPGETVAIKVLKEELASDADIVMRFLRERTVLLRLTHPNIVRVRDLVVDGELLALVMDLVDGPDLPPLPGRENGPLTPAAAALLTAHDRRRARGRATPTASSTATSSPSQRPARHAEPARPGSTHPTAHRLRHRHASPTRPRLTRATKIIGTPATSPRSPPRAARRLRRRHLRAGTCCTSCSPASPRSAAATPARCCAAT